MSQKKTPGTDSVGAQGRCEPRGMIQETIVCVMSSRFLGRGLQASIASSCLTECPCHSDISI